MVVAFRLPPIASRLTVSQNTTAPKRRSQLPFEENTQVAELVRIVHAGGVEVESELDHVGMGDNYAVDGHSAFTVPIEAVELVERTGVGCLAVAVRTAHGMQKGTPEPHYNLP